MTIKLTEAEKAEIRKKYASGNRAVATLAAQYSVAPSTIYRTVQGIHRPKAKSKPGQGWRQ